ncbi:hypothetical protein [Nocardioides sp. W7]|uniref:hypothetical protein n=1 Tax=Nocardioides sp. W7 TaxID=2931390 RepID=UPI001FD2EF4F|nr:hypothetical protein [Nocardioides sp. W7]
MHDWFDPDPYPRSSIDLADRVTHLVFVGGRLVDTWHERAANTEWAAYVDRPAPPPPPPPPPAPPHDVQVLDWLAEVCGGPAALDALDAEPLTDDATDLPSDYPDQESRERLEATATLLDIVADRWFDPETAHAFRNALLALWVEEPARVTQSRSAALLAGGVCWTVGKANGLFHPSGSRRVGTVQDTLGLPGSLSTPGREVSGALRGFRGHSSQPRPTGVPDLLPLWRSDVLLGATREQLVRLRDRARAAESAEAGGPSQQK